MMSARSMTPDSSGFPVRWSRGFAVVRLTVGQPVFTAAVTGDLCAVLETGAAGLIIELCGPGMCDSACLEALMRAARRARGWGAWLRLVIPDAGVRRLVRLVALDEVMPVHASLAAAVAAAVLEAPAGDADGD